MSITKATKANVSRVENGRIANTFEFMFNPNKLDRSRKTIWDFMNSPGALGSVAEFVRVDDQVITLEIFLAANRSNKTHGLPQAQSGSLNQDHLISRGLDGSFAPFAGTFNIITTIAEHYELHYSGVLADIAEIESWGLPSLDLFLEDDTQFISPPTLLFSYGKRTWECVATDISISETQHDKALNPTLAVARVTLRTKHDSFSGLRGYINGMHIARAGV